MERDDMKNLGFGDIQDSAGGAPKHEEPRTRIV